ncbi:MAG: HD domain-containing protein [Clostridia bacterium]|nr:HD domain-containing protein [Clostridia bacterium]
MTKGTEKDRVLSINDVLAPYKENHGVCDVKLIRNAYDYAASMHSGTKRGSGEAYINHPLRVARMVAAWGFEADVISAALLHDVVEDCEATLDDIGTLFGAGVRRIVDAVTALSDRDFADHTLTKVQRDILSDARLQKRMNGKALYVKIADRLDNLSTLDGVPEAKRIPKAEHTREIIIPMALCRHAYAYAEQLNELCFETEHPQMDRQIRERAKEICEENYACCSRTMDMLTEVFRPFNRPDCKEVVKFWQYMKGMRRENRSRVSIFRQISREADNIKKDWDKLLTKEHIAFYDLTVVVSDRILDENPHPTPIDMFFHCFAGVLAPRGMYLTGCGVTTYAKEVYFILADDMDNLYRVFVRQERDDRRYRHGDTTDDEGRIFPEINEIDPRDTYNEKIRVFRKNGSAMMIDRGATVLDFAFAIHTDLGLHFGYAMIDESKTQLPAYTRLNEGDTITIVADQKVDPSITWFNYVRTKKAIHHLVSYFQGRIPQEG